MMRLGNFQNTIIAGALATASILSYAGYSIQSYSSKSSMFEKSMTNLGFESEKQQEAVLNILHISGELTPKTMWRVINGLNLTNKETKFLDIAKQLELAGANLPPGEFSAKLLRKNLFGKEGGVFTQEEIDEFLFYLSQNAFGRKKNIERYQLEVQAWMQQYQELYLENAKNLGLVAAVLPTKEEYHFNLITGASRVGMLARILDNKFLEHSVGFQAKHKIIMSGARELWAEIDGLSEAVKGYFAELAGQLKDLNSFDYSLPQGDRADVIAEGSEFMQKIATKKGVVLLDPPLIKYEKGEDIPIGRVAGRTYLNLQDQSQMITEADAADALSAEYLSGENIIIINTKQLEGQRPTTETTTADTAAKIIEIIKEEKIAPQEITILVQSNQPYISYQAEIIKRGLHKAFADAGLLAEGYSISIEGVGFETKQGVAVIHSNLASLLAEKYKSLKWDQQKHEYAGRPLDKMLFSMRDNNFELADMPQSEGLIGVSDYMQSFFDKIL